MNNDRELIPWLPEDQGEGVKDLLEGDPEQDWPRDFLEQLQAKLDKFQRRKERYEKL